MTQRILRLAVYLSLMVVIAPARAGDVPAQWSTDVLLAEARQVMARAEPDKASESHLERIVLTLASRTPTTAARVLIEQLSTRQPQIMIAHEEGDAMMPFVDVGAAARYTMRTWTQAAAYDAATRATRSANPRLVQDYFAANDAARAGIIDAVSRTAAKDLVLYRDEVVRRIDEPGGDRLAAVFALSLADTALLGDVINTGSAAVALQTIRDLAGITDAATSLTLLRQATNRADIASATLFEVGRLMPTSPAAEMLLWDLLDDTELGASAAAALARHADNETINRLIDLLRHDTSPDLLKKRAVLALRLSGDERARQVANDMTEKWLVARPRGNR